MDDHIEITQDEIASIGGRDQQHAEAMARLRACKGDFILMVTNEEGVEVTACYKPQSIHGFIMACEAQTDQMKRQAVKVMGGLLARLFNLNEDHEDDCTCPTCAPERYEREEP